MTHLSKGFRKRLRRYRRKMKRILRRPVLYPLYIAIITLLIFSILFPERFLEFIRCNYWGPIVADVNGGYANGIREGYNPVNVTTYGLVLAFSIYLIYLILRRLKIWINFRLILAFTPLIIGAAFARVLEDAGMVYGAGAYMFVSPFIYLWIGILGMFILLYSELLERRDKYEAMVLSIIPYPLFIRFFWFLMGSIRVSEDIGFFIIVMSLYMGFHFFFVRRKDFERDSSVFLYSMFFLTVMTYYLSVPIADMGFKNPIEIPVVLSLAAIISLLIPIISRHSERYGEIFRDRTNMLMFFSQSLGAFVLLTSPSYGERYGIPPSMAFPILFLIVKITLVFLIIYLLDLRYREKIDENAGNLMKFTVIILGIGPGLRCLLDVSMGV